MMLFISSTVAEARFSVVAAPQPALNGGGSDEFNKKTLVLRLSLCAPSATQLLSATHRLGDIDMDPLMALPGAILCGNVRPRRWDNL